MNCGNCGTPLIPGNNICPKCGALNMGFPVQPNINNTNPPLTNTDNNIQASSDATLNNNVNNNLVSDNIMSSSQASVLQNLQITNTDTGITNNEIISVPEEENLATLNDVSDEQLNEDLDSVSESGEEEIELPKAAELTNDIKKEKKLKLKIKFDTTKKVPILICLGGIVLAIILGILLGSMLFSKNYCAAPSNIFNNDTQVVSDGKNNTTQAGHFVYKIPDIYMYDRESNGVSIYDKNSKFKIFVKTQKGVFDNITASKTSIKATLSENNITVNNIKEMKIEKKNYFIIEVTTKNVNRFMIFTDASNGFVFYSEIMNSDNEFNYDYLKILDDIIKNASYSSNSVTEMEKIDVVDPSRIVIKTSDEYMDKIKKEN